MKLLWTMFILAGIVQAKVVITPTVGKELTTPKKEFKDDEVLMGVGIQAYIDENFALDMRMASSDSNLMQDGGRTDLERGSFNLLYDFTPKYKVSPYLLAGLGYEKLHRTYLDIKSQSFYHTGAGLKFNIKDNLEFVTEVRYLRKKDTKDSEVIATCGFGVKIGSDECRVDCDSLKYKEEIKDQTIKYSQYKKQASKKSAKAAIKPMKKYDSCLVNETNTVIFSDEVVASNYLLKRAKTKSSKLDVKKGYKKHYHDKNKTNYIQVAALTNKNNIKNTLKKLRSKGLKTKTLKKGSSTVVLVGPYSKRKISNIYKSVKILYKDAFYKKL